MHHGAWRGILLVLIGIVTAGLSQPESDAPLPDDHPVCPLPDSIGSVPVLQTTADGQSSATTTPDTGSSSGSVPLLTVHNFPNPLQDHTTFVFTIPDDGLVRLVIFNRAGERISTLLQDEPLAGGAHLVNWNARNDRHQPVASGTYEYLLEWRRDAELYRIRKKLVVNRR